MVSFGLGKQDLGRREAETKSEKVHQFIYQRTYTSGAIVVALIAGFFFGVVPLGVFSILPDAFSKLILLAFVANVIAFLPSRWLHLKYRTEPIDYIFEGTTDNDERIKVYQYYQGQFKEDFELESGKLEAWRNFSGKTAYLVRSIDFENESVECADIGEYDDVELMQYEQKIEQNRLKNRKWARVGMKVFARLDALEDKVKVEYYQNLVKKGMEYTSYDSKNLMETVKDEIPELEEGHEEDEDDIKGMLQDLSDAGLETTISNQKEQSDGNE